MAVRQQQPPPNNVYYAPQQRRRNNRGGGGGGGYANGRGYPQQSTSHHGQQGGRGGPVRPPMPYKHYESWNYCSTHGGNVEDAHTSAMCNKRGPFHNPNATRTNMMGGSPAGMHKMILPSASGRTPPAPRQQQQLQCLPAIPYYPT
jgi:hypothetical protein